MLNRAVAYVEPYVIRLVFSLDPLAVPRVGLDAEALTLTLARLSQTLDAGHPLTLHVFADELLKSRVARHHRSGRGRDPSDLLGTIGGLPLDTNGEEF